MYRILIVDDEPIIVDGLSAYFHKRNLPDVEIVLAYSADEALSWLGSVKIDVILSDICMPEMDGMELLRHIERQWPRCKVILLTGHDEFDYVHKALRSECVTDYILKTEGMDRIGAAVDKALAAVKDELSVYHRKEWLLQELPKAAVQLQKQLLADMLRRTDAASFGALQTEFDALKLPFRADEPVLAVWLTARDGGKFRSVHERDLMLFAVGNIAEELLGARTVVKCVRHDGSSLIGLVQTAEQPFIEPARQRALAAGFVHGTLETIQQVCRDLFDIPLSAASSGRFFPFGQLAREAQRLRLAALSGSFRNVERLTVLGEEDEAAAGASDPSGRLAAAFHLEKLQQCLLEGNGADWPEHYRKLTAPYPEEGPADPFDRLLLRQSLCKLCLVCLEELGLKDRAVSQANLLAMLEFDCRTGWSELTAFFQSLLQWIQEMRSDNMRLEESNLIGRIHYFVQNHLDGDLSMARIAREVSLNPSYLSRWYKQTSGKGLSDYIQEVRVERGKELLRTTAHKMHDISEMLGFTDPHYFFRFFKRTVGCTPQEYRNKTSTT